jgi:hypothetical protein
MMTPALRRFTFATHITSSVGWVGAALAFLALAVIGFTTDDPVKARGAYLLMAPAAWFVLVPLAHASLLSGIVLSLGTTWGLFRYYWVVLKLGITVFATVILLIYIGTFRQMAGVAADPVVDLAMVRNASPIVHAIRSTRDSRGESSGRGRGVPEFATQPCLRQLPVALDGFGRDFEHFGCLLNTQPAEESKFHDLTLPFIDCG